MKRACQECDLIIVTVSLSAAQFGSRHEDFAHYPRSPEDDLMIVKEARLCDAFLQLTSEMIFRYGPQQGARVSLQADNVPDWCDHLAIEGECTMLMKLINLIRPDRVYLGERDLVRTRVMIRVVDDLLIPVQLVTVPTFRDEHGVAYDGRLRHASAIDLMAVRSLYRALKLIIAAYLNDCFSVNQLISLGEGVLAKDDDRFAIEHLNLVHPYGFHKLDGVVDPAIGCIAVVSVRLLYHHNFTISDNAILAPRIPDVHAGPFSPVVWKRLMSNSSDVSK